MSLLGWGSQKPKKHPTHLPANLQDDNQKFKIIVDSIEEGVILVDDEMVIQLINPGASTICGWQADEASQLNIHSVVQLVNEKGEPITEAQNPINKVFATHEGQRDDQAFIMTK